MVMTAMSVVYMGVDVNILIQSVREIADSILTGSSPISQTAGTILITAIWQGAVVAA